MGIWVFSLHLPRTALLLYPQKLIPPPSVLKVSPFVVFGFLWSDQSLVFSLLLELKELPFYWLFHNTTDSIELFWKQKSPNMSVSLPFIFTYHLPLSPITHSQKNLQRTKEPPLLRVVLSFQDFGLLGVSFAEFSVALMFCLWKGWRKVFSQRCSLSCSACPTSMAKKSGLLTFHCGILFTSKSIHLDLR